MSRDQHKAVRNLSLAACAVAVAATVGSGTRTENEPAVLEETAVLEDVQKYCTASWRNAGIDQQDWPDCTQQTLTFLLERVPRPQLVQTMTDGRSEERRELNRAIWRTVQRWRRAPRYRSLAEIDPLDRTAATPSIVTRERLEAAQAAAAAYLSPRQQQILKLWGDGWSLGEIAARLDLTPARASDEKYKAICKLRGYLTPVA